MACWALVTLRSSSLIVRCSPPLGRTIGCWRCNQPTILSSPFPRCLGTSAARSKESPTASEGASEFFAPTETFQDDPSRLSDVGLEDTISQSTSDAFQPVDMSSLGLGGNCPSGWYQTVLEVMYNYTHLPWWGCIIALTIIVRVALLPLSARLHVVSRKLQMVQREIPDIKEKFKNCRNSGDLEGERAAAAEMMKVYKRYNVNPLGMLPPVFIQGPILISVFRGLLGMTKLPVEGLKTGGVLWFPDLVLPDPLYGLSLLTCVCFLTNIECVSLCLTVDPFLPFSSIEVTPSGAGSAANNVKWVIRVAAVAAVPVTITLPSAIVLYIVTNTLFTSAQILLFKYPPFKTRFLTVPGAS